MHLFEYKLKRCTYKDAIVYILYVVCTLHGTVMDTCTFTFYFILFCSIIQSMFRELNKTSNSKQTIAKKLCTELN